MPTDAETMPLALAVGTSSGLERRRKPPSSGFTAATVPKASPERFMHLRFATSSRRARNVKMRHVLEKSPCR